MPTTLPTTGAVPETNRRILIGGAILVGLLSLPIVFMLLLEGVLAARCTTTTTASGVLVAKTLWRIERRECAGAKLPFYDLLIGVEGKTTTSALTGRGDPHPVGVTFMGEGQAQVILSGPLPGSGASSLGLRLRRSGSPMERIDLERLVVGGAGGRP